MDKLGYVILGWALGMLSILIREWLQERKEKHKIKIEILSDNLKFIFGTENIYNNIRADKSAFEKVCQSSPDQAEEYERKMYERITESFEDDFFPQLMFQSFQLKRLKDKSFWQAFESIANKYVELGRRIMDKENDEQLKNLNSEINRLKKAYVNKCLLNTMV